MRDNQIQLARGIAVLFDALVGTDAGATAAHSLHVAAISQDLGTPGSELPSCADSDVGDDGLLNPIRYGQAIRAHEPWTTVPAGVLPSRCRNDPVQYPSFLTFDAGSSSTTDLHEDFVCVVPFGGGGCGLEQQLEAAYRALVVHDAHDRPGNDDPNAGFVRDGAVLAILILSDEEDGSVRDCRHAEPGVACIDATSVFDSTSAAWASIDLNLRDYVYTPGSAQDPTWPLDRYVDPTNLRRGFPSLKPGAPELVIFAGIVGMPMFPPRTRSGGLDWDALLGTSPDGRDGFVGDSAEGPVSMRQANMDPNCITRVMPSCRREGSTYDPAMPPCNTTSQYFAWPSRRIVQVARTFEETWGNGTVSSICRNDYGDALAALARRITARFCAR